MTATQLRSDLQSSRARLFETIRGLTEEQFRFVPEHGGWNIATHLAHILRVERAVVTGCLSALSAHEPPMASAGASNDEDASQAQHLAVPQIIHGILASRRELETILERDATDLRRRLCHARLGVIAILDLLAHHAEHEAQHAGDVAALARQALSSARVIIPLTGRS